MVATEASETCFSTTPDLKEGFSRNKREGGETQSPGVLKSCISSNQEIIQIWSL